MRDLEVLKKELLDEASHLSGLSPRGIWVMGAGYSREEAKDFLFAQGAALSAHAVLNLETLCHKILAEAEPRPVLASHSRQLLLRDLLNQRAITVHLPHLLSLRRRKGFFEKLDKALQNGRMCFYQEEERQVHDQRLCEIQGHLRPLREEMNRLSAAYQAWMGGMGLEDPACLLVKAIQRLQEWKELPEEWTKLEYLRRFTSGFEPLERLFWEELSRWIPIRDFVLPRATEESDSPYQWKIWHSLDDAVEALAEDCRSSLETDQLHHVLIPDDPRVRRSLNRALRARGLPLADPRDPSQVRWDERVKRAMLPLELVASDFLREKVHAWIFAFFPTEATQSLSVIADRGVVSGLSSYCCPELLNLHASLEREKARYAQRLKVAEIKKIHQSYLESQDEWVQELFQGIWDEIESDHQLLGKEHRSLPLRYWLERLGERVSQASPPVEKLKPLRGVSIYRLSQASVLQVLTCRRLSVLALPPDFLSPRDSGDYWYSNRERELLSSEFQIKSSHSALDQKLTLLRNWISISEKVEFLDLHYDWDGKERPSLAPVLREVLGSLNQDAQLMPSDLLRRSSFDFPQDSALQTISLAAWSEIGQKKMSASALEDFSRCTFVGLARHRWRLSDGRDPELDLWPDAMGILLHQAAKLLVESRRQGSRPLSAQEAVAEVWSERPPKGMIRRNLNRRFSQQRMVRVLEAFLQKEEEYLQRSGVRPAYLDDELLLELEIEGITVKGKPDRVDQHPEGFFIIDYKSGSDHPTAKETLEKAYRLQMPFYAWAAQETLGARVIGTQFVELNLQAGRGKGIFFEAFNGKDEGKLTQVTRRNASLLFEDPQQVWPRLQNEIRDHVRRFADGQFIALPKRDSECRSCNYNDLCGQKRRPGQAD